MCEPSKFSIREMWFSDKSKILNSCHSRRTQAFSLSPPLCNNICMRKANMSTGRWSFRSRIRATHSRSHVTAMETPARRRSFLNRFHVPCACCQLYMSVVVLTPGAAYLGLASLKALLLLGRRTQTCTNDCWYNGGMGGSNLHSQVPE